MGISKGEIVKNFSHAELILTVDDNTNPILKFKVSNLDNADKYHALINSIIRSKTVVNGNINKSNTDELIKIAELYEKGFLTKEEFDTQKKKLLD